MATGTQQTTSTETQETLMGQLGDFLADKLNTLGNSIASAGSGSDNGTFSEMLATYNENLTDGSESCY